MVFFGLCTLTGVICGVAGAALWVWLADPARAQVTGAGAFYGEAELNSQVEVTLWFLALGVVGGIVAGLVVGWLGNRQGVGVVVAVLVLCCVASAVSAYVGMAVWGPHLPTGPDQPVVGSYVKSELEITTMIAYLGWPIGGVLGVLAAITKWPRSRAIPPDSSEPSHTVAQERISSTGS